MINICLNAIYKDFSLNYKLVRNDQHFHFYHISKPDQKQFKQRPHNTDTEIHPTLHSISPVPTPNSYWCFIF